MARSPEPDEGGDAARPTQPVDDTLDQHPPHEQVARLGTTAEEAEQELRRRQQTDFEGKVIPHRRLWPGMAWVVFLLGLLVIAWGLWVLF